MCLNLQLFSLVVSDNVHTMFENLCFASAHWLWFQIKILFSHTLMHVHIYQVWDSSAFTQISVEHKLKFVVDDDHFRRKKNQQQNKQKNPKQSEPLFGLSAFCRVLKLFPDVHSHCIVVLAFKNGHANRHHSRKKVSLKQEWRMVRGGNGHKERSTMKTSVSLLKNPWKYVLWSCLFLSIFEVKLELQNAPDCTYLHLDFKIFLGGMPPDSPRIMLTPLFGLSLNPTPDICMHPLMHSLTHTSYIMM